MGRPQPLTAVATGRSPRRRLLPGLLCAGIAASAASARSPSIEPSTLIVASGLGWLAWGDWISRRVPRQDVRVVGMAFLVSLLLLLPEPDLAPVARAAIAGTIALLALGALWWAKPEAIGFADVKLTALAASAAAAVSWLAVARVLLATTAVATFMAASVLIGQTRRRSGGWDRTIPLTPALCAGFIAGTRPW